MKTSIKTAVAATLIALGALGTGTAMARGGDCDGYMSGERAGWHRMSPERIKDRADLGLARLELALAIKPEQKAAWDQFKTAMLERAGTMATQMAAHAKDAPPKTALERMERMETFGKERVADLASTRRDVQAIYAQLSDAQKKVFDAEFRDGRFGGHRGTGHHGHGMRGDDRPHGMNPDRGPRPQPGQVPGSRS